jgi:hypothetical protein
MCKITNEIAASKKKDNPKMISQSYCFKRNGCAFFFARFESKYQDSLIGLTWLTM